MFFFTLLLTLDYYYTSIGWDLFIGFGTDEDEVDLAFSFLRADARIGVLLKMKLS